MIAKVIWKAKNRISGRVPASVSASTPARATLSSPPQMPLVPPPKAIEYPNRNHKTLIRQAME